MSVGCADSASPSGDLSNEAPTNPRTYTQETLIKAYKHFVCPEGIEEHASVYSPQCLLPELFSPDAPFWQVVAAPPRAKRPLSDLTDRPRGGAGTSSAAVVRDRDSVADPVNAKPKPRGMDGWAGMASAGHRAYNEFVGPAAFGPSGRATAGFRTSRPDLSSDREDGPLVGGAPNTRFVRPTNATFAEGARAAAAARANAPGALTVSHPHTAESWERLGQKLRATSKLGSDDRTDGAELGDSADRGAANMMMAQPQNFDDVHGGHPAMRNRRLPDGVMKRLLDGELYQENFGDAVASAPLILADQRFALPMAESGGRFGLPSQQDTRNIRPGMDERNTLQQLMAKAHSAQRPPPQPMTRKPDDPSQEPDPQHLRAVPGPPPPLRRPQLRAPQNLTDLIVRWTDGRPLYITHRHALAQDLSRDLTAVETHIQQLRNEMERRAALELYETKIASIYDQLVRAREVVLPEPLSRAMKITRNMSLALWPSFREVFLQSESLLEELNRWETEASQIPLTQQQQLGHHQPTRVRETATSSNDVPFPGHWHVDSGAQSSDGGSLNRDMNVLGRQGYSLPAAHMPFPMRKSDAVAKPAPNDHALPRVMNEPLYADGGDTGVRGSPFNSNNDRWVSGGAPNTVRGQPLPTAPTQPSNVMPVAKQHHQQSDRTVLPATWEYLDPHKVIQGPFSSEKMYNWWRRDFFPDDLPVRPSGNKSFFALSTLYPPELEARFRPFIDRPPFQVVESESRDSFPSEKPRENGPPSYASRVREQSNRNTQQREQPSSSSPADGQMVSEAAGASYWKMGNTTVAQTDPMRPSPQPRMPEETTTIVNDHDQILPKQPMAVVKSDNAGYSSVVSGGRAPASVRRIPERSQPADLQLNESVKQTDTMDESGSNQYTHSNRSSRTDPQGEVQSSAVRQRNEDEPTQQTTATPAPVAVSAKGQGGDQGASTSTTGNVWSERPGPSAWTSRVVNPVDSASKNTDEHEEVGPSLAESRNVPRVHEDSSSNLAKASFKKKFKGKKQSLGELIINNGLEQRNTSVWGNKAVVPPPRKESAWIQVASANIPVKEHSSETSPSVKASETGKTHTPVTAAQIVKANLPPIMPDAPHATVKTSAKTPLPAAAQQKTVAAIPSEIQNNGSTSASASPAIRSSAGGGEVYDEQKESIRALCIRHNIVVDSDFVGLLLGCEDIDDVSSLLSDNLKNPESEIEAFVQEFWDLVRNPFKPVQKGNAGGGNSRSGGGAGGKLLSGGMHGQHMGMAGSSLEMKPTAAAARGRKKPNKKR